MRGNVEIFQTVCSVKIRALKGSDTTISFGISLLLALKKQFLQPCV